MKKTPFKVAHNRPNFFSNYISTALSCPYGQKLKIKIGNWAEAPSVIYTLGSEAPGPSNPPKPPGPLDPTKLCEPPGHPRHPKHS